MYLQSLSDLQRDVPALFEIVEQDPEFKEIMSEMDEDEAEASVDEALEVLHCFPGPEENMGSCSTHTDSCLVIAVLQQWLVRYLCRRLMQVMTPEALAIHQLRIPNSYCVNYLMHQYHFSLKDLISSQFQLLQTERYVGNAQENTHADAGPTGPRPHLHPTVRLPVYVGGGTASHQPSRT